MEVDGLEREVPLLWTPVNMEKGEWHVSPATLQRFHGRKSVKRSLLAHVTANGGLRDWRDAGLVPNGDNQTSEKAAGAHLDMV